jgi:hypothetical protein
LLLLIESERTPTEHQEPSAPSFIVLEGLLAVLNSGDGHNGPSTVSLLEEVEYWNPKTSKLILQEDSKLDVIDTPATCKVESASSRIHLSVPVGSNATIDRSAASPLIATVTYKLNKDIHGKGEATPEAPRRRAALRYPDAVGARKKR